MINCKQKEESKLHLITEDSKKEIDHWISKYPQGQQKSAVMSALRILQDQTGRSCRGNFYSGRMT